MNTRLPTLSIRAQAKLNLHLAVLGRESSGLHRLSMLNHTISLADDLTLSPADEDSFTVESDELPVLSEAERRVLADSDSNLATRAIAGMRALVPDLPRLALRVIKRLPVGGGIGGGSSDAAAALRLCADIAARSGAAVPAADLQRLASRLGSDVPYFLTGGLARISGTGERVTSLDGAALEGKECVVVFPPFGTSTAQVYAEFRASGAFSTDELPEAGAVLSYDEICALISNGLESSAIRLYPALAGMLAAMRSIRGAVSSLSGSGSTMFALPLDAGGTAERLQAEVSAGLEGSGARVFRARFEPLAQLTPVEH